MTIKEFAGLCGCTAQTLRYYDRIGLLKPERTDPWRAIAITRRSRGETACGCCGDRRTGRKMAAVFPFANRRLTKRKASVGGISVPRPLYSAVGSIHIMIKEDAA